MDCISLDICFSAFLFVQRRGGGRTQTPWTLENSGRPSVSSRMMFPVLFVGVALCLCTVRAQLTCPALTAFTLGSCPTRAEYGNIAGDDIDLSTLMSSQVWSTRFGGKYAKPSGYEHNFYDSGDRWVNFKVMGFGQCTEHIGLEKMGVSWCPGSTHCAFFGTREKYDWGGTQRGFFAIQPSVSPYPAVDNAVFGACDTSTPDGSADYKLENFGAMTLTFAQPTTRAFQITIADLDGRGSAREGAAVFGIDSAQQLVNPTAVPGSAVTAKTAELPVAEAQSIGLAGAETIDFMEANGGGKSQTDTTAYVTYTFTEPIMTLVFVMTWVNPSATEMAGSNSGFVILTADPWTPKIGCSVPCTKTYDPNDTDGTCAPGESLFDVNYDAASSRICGETDYCDTCTGTNKVKLVEPFTPGRKIMNPDLGPDPSPI